jgi:formylglycine-generating enzyme required for sulfatase activity
MLVAFKLKIALACAAGLAGPFAVAPLLSDLPRHEVAPSEQSIIDVKPGAMFYRVAGDFTQSGKPAEAPLSMLRFVTPLTIMKHQVSSADYQACVDDGGCRALDRDVAITLDRPAVQVSFHDTEAYAAWLSRRTGEAWRLPTDEEWAFAAGSKFADDGLPADNDPSKRWLARYAREATADEDTRTLAFGAFGANENGLLDLSGNVWEWTTTCFIRTVLDDAGRTIRQNANCGVRVAEGAHRADVTDFIRDARAGGCVSGTPPTNLGFRLVREPKSLLARIASAFVRINASKPSGIARS